MTDSTRDHDIVVYGATGFVGLLTAGYLAERAPPDVRIALGGRSQPKLERTRTALGVDWPLVIADSQDRNAVAALAESTRVVATTVGPYFKYGKPLLEACAAAGTYYADLTGEVLFMRWAIDAAHGAAQTTGARIVHTCGFDSIPSDIGTLLLHEAAQAGGHGELGETSFVVKAMRGGASGGTIDSVRTAVDTVKKDPPSRRVLADPYALSPDRAAEPDLGSERDSLKPLRDDRLGGWLAPFVMGSVNTRVVRRSNALQDHAYGRRFRYRASSCSLAADCLAARRPPASRAASPVSSRALRRQVRASCSTASSRTPARDRRQTPASAASSTSISTRRQAAASA